MGEHILPLDPNQRSTDTLEFQTSLRSKIVGQEEGVQALVDLYQVFCAGLNSPGRPVGNLDSVRRCTVFDQGRLRRIPAFP